jgi:ABC-type sugar transport system permease subunit
MLPSFLGILLFMVVPVLITFSLSFSEYSPGMNGFSVDFVGLENFMRLFGDERFKKSLLNSVIYVGGTVPLILVCSTVLAALLNGFAHYRTVLRTIFFIPSIASIVSISIVWLVLFNPENGPINQILTNVFNIQNPPTWFVSTTWLSPVSSCLFLGRGLGTTWVVLISQACKTSHQTSMRQLPLMGQTSYRNSYISLSHSIAPMLFFVLDVSTINVFKIFDPIKIMTEGGPGYSYFLFGVQTSINSAFQLFDIGYASSVSMILFAIIFTITTFAWKWQKRLLPNTS